MLISTSKKNLRSLGKQGDTIVEVLIAVVVVSTVLVGAFTIANKSSQAVRMAQERSEAMKIAAGEVEHLMSSVPAGVGQCFNAAATPPGYVSALTVAIPALGSSGDVDGSYKSECKSGAGVTYSRFIDNDSPPSGTPKTYTVHVRWDGLNGTRQEVTYKYRAAN